MNALADRAVCVVLYSLVLRLVIGVLNQFEEFGGCGFHAVHVFIDLGIEVGIAEVGQQTNDEAGSGGDHFGVDATCDGLQRKAFVLHIEEQDDHTRDGAEEAQNRGYAGNGAEYGEVFFEEIKFQLAAILHGFLNIVNGLADAAKAFFDDIGEWCAGFSAGLLSAGEVAILDLLADTVHKQIVGDGCLADGKEALEEDVDHDDGA